MFALLAACSPEPRTLAEPAAVGEVETALNHDCATGGDDIDLLGQFAPLVVGPAEVGSFLPPDEAVTSLDASDDGHLAIGTRSGLIYRWDGSQLTQIADLRGDTSTVADQGLLDVAWFDTGSFDTAWSNTAWSNTAQLLVLRTNRLGATVLTVVSSDPSAPGVGTVTEALSVDQPDERHNGGGLAVDPTTGEIFVGIGDGGEQGDPSGMAGDPSQALGSILRGVLDPVSLTLQPSPNRAGLIWATGVRNPHRLWFAHGSLWVADVGENCREEVNRLDVGAAAYDLGWNAWEGDIEFVADRSRRATAPVGVYSHHDQRCAVIGGAALPAAFDIERSVVVADLCSGELIVINDGGVVGKLPAHISQPIDVSTNTDGSLLIATMDGSVLSLTR